MVGRKATPFLNDSNLLWSAWEISNQISKNHLSSWWGDRSSNHHHHCHHHHLQSLIATMWSWLQKLCFTIFFYNSSLACDKSFTVSQLWAGTSTMFHLSSLALTPMILYWIYFFCIYGFLNMKIYQSKIIFNFDDIIVGWFWLDKTISPIFIETGNLDLEHHILTTLVHTVKVDKKWVKRWQYDMQP